MLPFWLKTTVFLAGSIFSSCLRGFIYLLIQKRWNNTGTMFRSAGSVSYPFTSWVLCSAAMPRATAPILSADHHYFIFYFVNAVHTNVRCLLIMDNDNCQSDCDFIGQTGRSDTALGHLVEPYSALPTAVAGASQASDARNENVGKKRRRAETFGRRKPRGGPRLGPKTSVFCFSFAELSVLSVTQRRRP